MEPARRFGSAFVEEYFKDGVFACGTDGEWRLHGRVKPEYFDVAAGNYFTVM